MEGNLFEDQEDAFGKWFTGVILQNKVLGNAKVFDDAIVHALFRDVGEAGFKHLSRRIVGDVLVFHEDTAVLHSS